jgi:Holliday junction resolvase RusA-like endonuclease
MRARKGPIVVAVRGTTPKGLNARNQEWKAGLEEASQKIHGPRVNPETEFSVEATFHLLPQDEWRLVDLDNLAKPLLDSLFRPKKLPAPDGTKRLFEADDGQVVELILRKTVVTEERDQGVEVRVTWTEAGAGLPGFKVSSQE